MTWARGRGARRARVRRGRGETGSAVLEFVWLGTLLLVPVVWILLSVFEVQRGAFAVSAAARAAGRAYVLAPDAATGQERAVEAARFTLDDQGGDAMPLDLEVACSGSTTSGTTTSGTSTSTRATPCLAPGTSVTVTVRSGVHLPFLPDILRAAESDFSLEASHTLPAGSYVERP